MKNDGQRQPGLCITIRPGDVIQIGPDVTVFIEVKNDGIHRRMRIVAPKDITVTRTRKGES